MREIDSSSWTGRKKYLGISRGPIEHAYRKREAIWRSGVCFYGCANIVKMRAFGCVLLDVYAIEKGAKTYLHVYYRAGIRMRKHVYRSPKILNWDWWSEIHARGTSHFAAARAAADR
jgi:hypothetical protein